MTGPFAVVDFPEEKKHSISHAKTDIALYEGRTFLLQKAIAAWQAENIKAGALSRIAMVRASAAAAGPPGNARAQASTDRNLKEGGFPTNHVFVTAYFGRSDADSRKRVDSLACWT